MIICYLNYPNPQKNVHLPDGCIHVHKHGGGRYFRITPANFSSMLNDFLNEEVDFASKKGLNDLYLEIDFDDRDFEIATFKYITRLLGKRYNAFTGEIHKCSACFS